MPGFWPVSVSQVNPNRKIAQRKSTTPPLCQLFANGDVRQGVFCAVLIAICNPYHESLQGVPNRPDYLSRTDGPTIKVDRVRRGGFVLWGGEDRSAAR